jgi:hypothetical protein
VPDEVRSGVWTFSEHSGLTIQLPWSQP